MKSSGITCSLAVGLAWLAAVDESVEEPFDSQIAKFILSSRGS